MGLQDELPLTPERELLAKYLLQRLLWKDGEGGGEGEEGEQHLVYPDSEIQLPGEQSQVVPTFVKAPSNLREQIIKHEKEESEEEHKPESIHPKSRFSMPLVTLGEKKYYIGTFFKANWYKAAQYCRFHGLHLASIDTEEVQEAL